MNSLLDLLYNEYIYFFESRFYLVDLCKFVFPSGTLLRRLTIMVDDSLRPKDQGF